MSGYFLYLFIFLDGKCKICYNQFTVGNNIIHIHHWIISIVLLFFLERSNVSIQDEELYNFLKGLLVSGILHGIIEYDDWYFILYKYKK